MAAAARAVAMIQQILGDPSCGRAIAQRGCQTRRRLPHGPGGFAAADAVIRPPGRESDRAAAGFSSAWVRQVVGGTGHHPGLGSRGQCHAWNRFCPSPWPPTCWLGPGLCYDELFPEIFPGQLQEFFFEEVSFMAFQRVLRETVPASIALLICGLFVSIGHGQSDELRPGFHGRVFALENAEVTIEPGRVLEKATVIPPRRSHRRGGLCRGC